MKEIRIQKYLADSAVASRRAAEKLVSDGKVTVNGAVALIGQSVDPDNDVITVEGNPVKRRVGGYTYILLNKPIGYLSTAKDDRGRSTVCDLVRIPGKRLFPAGRLDMYTEGLLILSDDGETVNRLTHPKGEVSKEYRAVVAGDITEDVIKQLSEPISIDGKATRPATVNIVSASENESIVLFTINEGRNRQIRRLCERSRLRIKRLTRTRIGRITDDKLPLGKWRSLTPDEIEYVKGL